MAKVSLGRVVRLLLDRSTCLQEEKQNNIMIEMKGGRQNTEVESKSEEGRLGLKSGSGGLQREVTG